MTKPARYDPPVHAAIPDPALISRAQRAMMAAEDEENDRRRLIRQHWEAAFGGVRVAMDSLREIYPVERSGMTDTTSHRMEYVTMILSWAYASLDDMSDEVLGSVMRSVLEGGITTHEELDDLGVPR